MSINAPFACVGIIRGPSKVVAVSRRNKPELFGFPGGKRDPGESAEDCLKRELMEELGIEVLECELLLNQVDDVQHSVNCYLITRSKGVIEQKEPGIIPTWRTREEMLSENAPFRNYNRACFEELERRYPPNPPPARG